MRKKLTRKLSPLLLLFLSAVPLLFVLLLQVKQTIIQQQVKNKLEKKHLQTLTLRKEEVRWIKKDKEILVNKRMFDIKSVILRNGLYIFTGLYDEDETVLMEQVRKNHPGSSHNTKWMAILFNFLQALYDDPLTEGSLRPYSISAEFIPARTPALLTQFISKFIPPPRT